ncbi:putative Hydrolase or acyltransferase [Candidatus Terasakiella magnetica]|uniref:Putative Hydrolase or acyltransferase n=1 Tax=Candidatus Terasakiella magnetica TaxID=1867952 RepID=A0A1C3RCD7_9PROT|nr:hypothetical protein [Candidatus Terasakiella magnetica]SCA54882.1 putative Hydrolase or acyltransferase [Candidatus Terasakiella magnetica]
MTKLIFVHGWGFDASFWDGLRAELPDFDTACVDLGFFNQPEEMLDPDAVYITHSMGMAWVLETVKSCKGLIAINGFSKFCADENWANGVAPRMLSRMIRQFEKTPEKVWTDFMVNCGHAEPILRDTANEQLLLEGLQYLESCDVREKLEGFDAPFLAIAAQKDRIVPENLTRASFGEDVIWYKEGNHLLPMFETKSLAEHIQRFLDRV